MEVSTNDGSFGPNAADAVPITLPWSVFEGAKDAAIVLEWTRHHSVIVRANTALCTLAGTTIASVVGAPLRSLLVHDEEWRVVRHLLHRLQAQPVRAEVTVRCSGPNETKPVELELIPFVEQATGRRCLVILRDLSDHRYAVEFAARADERLRLATDVGQIGTWEWRPLTGELLWDRKLRSILGAELPMAASLALWTELLSPEDRERAHEEAQALLHGEIREYESRYRIRRFDDGGTRFLLARTRVSEYDDLGNAVCLIGVLLDVTELEHAAAQREVLLAAEREARAAAERASDELRRLATSDPLTGLANRSELERWLAATLRRRDKVAVLFFDLDRFKAINDSYNHSVGDTVLQEMARRLHNNARSSDLVARFGGDEFVVAGVVRDDSEATELAQRLLAKVRAPIASPDVHLGVTASVGLVLSGHDDSPSKLLANADLALYHAKRQGRNRAVWFHHAHRQAMAHQLGVESELRSAIDAGQLRLHFQPAYRLATGEPTSAEALVRWQHPRRGLVGPSYFIAIAENSDVIHPLGQWVMSEAARVRRFTPVPDTFTLFVNSSIREISRDRYADDMLEIISGIGLQPRQLGLEVTESAFSDDPAALGQLEQLHDRGVKIALDDFGTGFSSLSRLWQYPIDIIKVDRTFVSELETSNTMRAIVTSIIGLARALGSTTIAEGVETPGQLAILKDLGCDHVSGYLLNRPVPVEAFFTALRQVDLRWVEPAVAGQSRR